MKTQSGVESLFTCGASLRVTTIAPPEKLFEPLMSCCGGPHNDDDDDDDDDDEDGCGGGSGWLDPVSSSSSEPLLSAPSF
jgi:hypothetical protein